MAKAVADCNGEDQGGAQKPSITLIDLAEFYKVSHQMEVTSLASPICMILALVA